MRDFILHTSARAFCFFTGSVGYVTLKVGNGPPGVPFQQGGKVGVREFISTVVKKSRFYLVRVILTGKLAN